MAEQGALSINSENMFPIIKKWLYSDQDIFLRELVSNGCDAVTKLKKLEMMGDFTAPEGYKPRLDVEVCPAERTLSVTDNGLGMTADEVREYINNIAFSGAEDFLSKYKDKAGDDQIIGHFGLGFYSAFMVADLVTIDTLSYKDGEKAMHWECDGSSSYTMEETKRDTFGTTVTLHLSEDCVQFSNYYKVKETLEKYCGFMPYEIYLKEKGGENDKEPELVNETAPLWTKNPAECKEEDYKEFYRKVFRDYKEPLFWIHLNMDYPFNLKGILYFPKINLEYESAEGIIKLYNNQVFIADNIKEVIPEFLMLLKGVIDCPDLPLNVSRSALQNDGFVTKISEYITKKVADKLSGMCKTDRENYEKYWEDISPFIKYGCLRDEKFCKRMTDYILFRDLDGKYLALPDALHVNRIDPGEEAEKEEAAETENSAENAGEKEAEDTAPVEDQTIYYVTDPVQQGQYIRLFRERKLQAFLLNHGIDQPFISQLEAKNEGIHFARIDAGVQDTLKARVGKKAMEEMNKEGEALSTLMQKAVKNDKLNVKLEKLKDKKVASMLIVSEESRRFRDMMKMYSTGGDFPDPGAEGQTLVLNAAHPLVAYLSAHKDDKEAKNNLNLIAKQLYDLARLQNEPLPADDMNAFVLRSNEIMEILTQ
ncbi:MAG: molecular chaperone HtpG [Lachnospiraceae bacterium]|nr:molecular chaperone HtpG [Lachnospiraceae bacterium]